MSHGDIMPHFRYHKSQQKRVKYTELSHAAKKLRRLAITPPISSRKRKKMMMSLLRKVSWLSINRSYSGSMYTFCEHYDWGCLVQDEIHEHALSISTVLNMLIVS